MRKERINTDRISKSTKFPSSGGMGPENRLLSMLLKDSFKVTTMLYQMKLLNNLTKRSRAYRA